MYLQQVVIKNARKLNKSISSRVVILKASRSIDEGGESSATTAKVSLVFGACKSSKRLTMILIISRLIRRALDIQRHWKDDTENPGWKVSQVIHLRYICALMCDDAGTTEKTILRDLWHGVETSEPKFRRARLMIWRRRSCQQFRKKHSLTYTRQYRNYTSGT